jgi:hypothetical protein
MHFEIFASPEAALSGSDSLLTSQFALPAETAQALYAADPRYTASVANMGQVSLSGDMVFGDNTPEQLGAMTLTLTGDVSSGFKASGIVGIAI